VNGGGPNHPGSLRFRRGALPTATGAPLGAFLNSPVLTIFPEEVPREGAQLKRRFRFARGFNSTYLWIGRERLTGEGEGSSGLKFDYLET
jgi:hypothetical protein